MTGNTETKAKAQAQYPMFKDPSLADTPEAHMNLATQITLFYMGIAPVKLFTFLDPTIQGMLEDQVQMLHAEGHKNLPAMADMWGKMPGVIKDTFARYIGGRVLGQEAFEKSAADFHRRGRQIGEDILDSLLKKVNVPAYLAAQKEAAEKAKKEGTKT